MKILVACEYSGTVRDAFIAKGHDAISCDLIPTESPGPHHQGDVFDILDDRWDIIIAHPPCTYLCNSGVRWLHDGNSYTRYAKMIMAAAFFRAFIDICPRFCHRIAVENPIPHCHALDRMGGKYSQIIQPWQFGHGETKATCLWLQGLPLLEPTDIVDGREARIHKMGPSKDRAKMRAKTFPGIANAMADQWG